MTTQPTEGAHPFGDRPGTNRIQERVAQNTGDHVEVPAGDEAVDHLVKPDVEERLEESPEEQKNFTDPDREEQVGE